MNITRMAGMMITRKNRRDRSSATASTSEPMNSAFVIG
jgi:hypothetical protein